MEKPRHAVRPFSVAREYARCITALRRTGLLTFLPQSGLAGVVGLDGQEYPLPTQEQVVALFAHNSELVGIKAAQGFDRLELTPLALPAATLMDRMKAAIERHAAAGEVYQTRRSPALPLVPVRVSSEKQVWIWSTLAQALDTDEVVYFPQEYAGNHRGQTKLQVIHNRRFCAVPGWSVGLVESYPMMPQPGAGQTLGGRRQLEIGSSPRDYLAALQTQAYQGETGRTLEDFGAAFLVHLEATHEISHDRHDDNALWLLGQYVPYVPRLKSDLVPTAWWHRHYGRVRLDAHRPGNRLCTKSWGGATTVRLLGI
jgi:hypothetical protein